MTTPVSTRIAANVRRLRIEKSLTQYTLADLVTKIGPSKFRQPQVSDIERGKSPQITVDTLEKIARALECSLDSLVTAHLPQPADAG
jgi:transcriptional regulator with XRE-family HTH domain